MLILDLYINAFRFTLIYVNYEILFYLFYFNFTQQLMKNPIAIFLIPSDLILMDIKRNVFNSIQEHFNK